MQRSKPSINDLARKLKVSKTTISFILNGKGKEKRISDELIARVQKEASKLGYQPNQFAKGLRTGRTNIIGLMVEDISNPFYANIAKLIEDKVYQNGYRIVYCSSENNEGRAREFLDMFSTLGVDGCIIVPTKGIEGDIKAMEEKGKCVVLFDRRLDNKQADCVMIDNRKSMYEAVEHLVSRGYRDIGLVAMALGKPALEDRIMGYTDAMKDYNLNRRVFPLPFKVQYRDYVPDILRILEKNRNLDAIIFGTNYLGVAGLEAISLKQLRIPTDIAILSFDDHDLFRIHSPSITVVSQPIEEIAQTVIDTLLKNLKEPRRRKRGATTTLSTTLVVRHSS